MVPAVQLVAQQTLTLVLVSSVTQAPLVHWPPTVQVAPFASRLPESPASVVLPESTLESMCEPVSALEESTLEESVLELESVPVLESPPELESPPPVSGVVLSVPMLSPSGPSPMVTSSRPPSCGILLRSKSTSSSQPAASIAPHVTAAVTRPHLIERFVFIDVFPEQP
jgi:hypothetical protein